MGTYDELAIAGIAWQTKALGKRMGVRRPGDEVQVQRVASTDDPSDVEAYTYDEVPDRYVVQVMAVEYALVEDGKLVGLAGAADREELHTATFDYYGRDEHDQLTHEAGGFEPERPARAMTRVPRRVRPTRQRRPDRPTEAVSDWEQDLRNNSEEEPICFCRCAETGSCVSARVFVACVTRLPAGVAAAYRTLPTPSACPPMRRQCALAESSTHSLSAWP